VQRKKRLPDLRKHNSDCVIRPVLFNFATGKSVDFGGNAEREGVQNPLGRGWRLAAGGGEDPPMYDTYSILHRSLGILQTGEI